MRPFAVALFAFAAASSVGCRRSLAPLCRQICVCSPCTPLDFDDCVAKGDAAQASAEKSGCGDPFDTLIDCLESNISCRSGGAGPGTDQCARADRAMVLCDGSVNPFGSPCDEAVLKSQTCTGMIPSTPMPPIVPCNGDNACISSCQLAQPCDVLDGTASSQTLMDCTTQCQMMHGPLPP